jgi:hypothetical protein
MAIEQALLNFVSIGWENPLIQNAAVTLLRALPGWIENATEDLKITWPEIQQLGVTYFRLIPQVLGLSALLGPDAGPLGALITDFFATKVIKKKK